MFNGVINVDNIWFEMMLIVLLVFVVVFVFKSQTKKSNTDGNVIQENRINTRSDVNNTTLVTKNNSKPEEDIFVTEERQRSREWNWRKDVLV